MGEAQNERPCADPDCWCCNTESAMERARIHTVPHVPSGAIRTAERMSGFTALMRHDREHGIVRVDTRSDETVERIARALHARLIDVPDTEDHWAWVADRYRGHARAVLASLLTEHDA